MASQNKKTTQMKKVGIRERQSTTRRVVLGIVLILFCIYGAYAFYAANPTIIDKAVGKYALNYLFGRGTMFFILYGIVCGILIIGDNLRQNWKIMLLVLAILIEMLVIMSVNLPNILGNSILDFFGTIFLGSYGGVFGMVPAFLFITILRKSGFVIALMTILILVELFLIFRNLFPSSYSDFKEKRYGMDWAADIAGKIKGDKLLWDKKLEERRKRDVAARAEDENDDLFGSSDGVVSVDTQYLNINDVMERLAAEEKEETQDFEPRERVKRLGKNNTRIKARSERPSNEVVVGTGLEDLTDTVSTYSGNYVFPDTALLNPAVRKGGDKREVVRKKAAIIQNTLNNFGVKGKIVDAEVGPAITRFVLEPEPGIKVSKIVGLSDDLALALAASDIRMEAPIPGRAAVGIEVPNDESDVVSLREIVESAAFKRTKAVLPIALGKTLSGQNIIGDISKMPHVLIAGATGSGKSVCINTIIMSLLYKKTPEELKFIMIDPKMVELNQYNHIPHQLIPVVTDPKKAASALNWGIKEMTTRYELFKDAGVRDIDGYNKKQEALGEPKLPRIIIVIDELADLMMTSPKEVENAICRIAQLARACGIHLIIATQRPSVDVITGLIKANIPSRIAFAVASNTDSRTILDMAGAEKLLGKGDMLYFPVGKSKPLRVQGTFVDDEEINRVIDSIGGVTQVTFDPRIEKVIETYEATDDRSVDSQKDMLFDKAVAIAFENNQISTSMIQRRLKVGYARAGRIVDELENAGIISGPNGSKPRMLLMSKEDYYVMENAYESE